MKLYEELTSAYPPGYAKRAGLPKTALYLAERAVITCNRAYLVRTVGGVWKNCNSRKAAQLALEQNWLGGGEDPCTRAEIVDFLTNDVPVVDGLMKVPNSAAPIVAFMGRKFVNAWNDRGVIKPDIEALDDPEVQRGLTKLLRMIRESLCAKDGEKSLQEMIAIANSDDPAELEFRVLMTWLAAPLQQIGRNLQINVWLVGEMNGTGKGTLNSIMTQIYGADNTAILNIADLENRGWTDGLAGKLWVNVNELNTVSSKMDYNSFLKQYTTEDWLTITQRGCDAQQILNFANWLITSNKERPTCIDVADRRHFLIATTNDINKAALAVELRQWMSDHPAKVRGLLGAFVALLVHEQVVDETLLVRAQSTPLKEEVRENTGEDADMEWWLVNDTRYPRDRWQRSTDLVLYFNNCFSGSKPYNPRMFGGRLSKFSRKGKLEMRKWGTASAEYMIPADRYPVPGSVQQLVTTNVIQLDLAGKGGREDGS